MRHLIIVVALSLVVVACGETTEEGSIETTGGSAASAEESTQSGSVESQPEATSTTTTVASEEQANENKLPEPVPSTEPAGEPVRGAVPDDLMNSILEDVYSRTGAAESAITVVRAVQALWNDGSLGCALPGENYTQALVNGYWVVFDHAGTTYDYRASSTGIFKLCEGGGQPPSNPTG